MYRYVAVNYEIEFLDVIDLSMDSQQKVVLRIIKKNEYSYVT